jgi:exonuclease SbcD
MAIRILHTSDWHLGKKLFKRERTQEHQAFLSWLLSVIKEREVDALLIAGDIFDSPTPPTSALKMYYDFLAQLSELNCHAYIISGNHDSAGLLQSTQSLLNDKNIFLNTSLAPDYSLHCHKIWDKEHKSYVKLKSLPYFRNHELLDWVKNSFDLSQITLDNKVEILTKTLTDFFHYWPESFDDMAPSILMGHHLFGSFIEAGSEQSLSLSGLDSIPSSLLKDFQYVALGHIHKTQYICHEPPMVYPGSPMAMRFSESNQKTVSLIECQGQELEHELLAIPVFKPLIQKKCDVSEVDRILCQIMEENKNQDAYLELMVQMDSPRSGLTDHIRDVLKDSHIELLSFIPQYQVEEQENIVSSDIHQYGIQDLFEKYYQQKFPDQNIPQELLSDFKDLIDEVGHENP